MEWAYWRIYDRLLNFMGTGTFFFLAVRNPHSQYVIVPLFKFFFNVLQIAKIPACGNSGGLTLWAQR